MELTRAAGRRAYSAPVLLISRDNDATDLLLLLLRYCPALVGGSLSTVRFPNFIYSVCGMLLVQINTKLNKFKKE